MSKVQVDTIDTRSGTSTMQIGSTNTSTINIGVSGDTVNIPSGVTIANAGTATGFGDPVDNDPMVSAKFTGSQSISSSTQTIVTCFTSEPYDYDNTWNGSRFTVPSGITDQPFFMAASVRVASLDDGGRLELSFFVNGTEALNTRTMASGNAATMATDATYSQQLSTGDYVEIKVFHNSSGSKSMAGGFFHVHKLIKG